jgi:hypothetical protein
VLEGMEEEVTDLGGGYRFTQCIVCMSVRVASSNTCGVPRQPLP